MMKMIYMFSVVPLSCVNQVEEKEKRQFREKMENLLGPNLFSSSLFLTHSLTQFLSLLLGPTFILGPCDPCDVN